MGKPAGLIGAPEAIPDRVEWAAGLSQDTLPWPLASNEGKLADVGKLDAQQGMRRRSRDRHLHDLACGWRQSGGPKVHDAVVRAAPSELAKAVIALDEHGG